MSAGHVDDGALIRLLDGECTAAERAAVGQHLATCAPCDERRRALEALARAVTTTLAHGDARSPAPARAERRRPSQWRLRPARAAAVLLLVGVGVAAARVPPVRAWLSARWTNLRELMTPRRNAEPERPGSTTVRFVPTTATFAIELMARQDTGVLSVVVSGDSVASATVSPGMGHEELVVLPSGLRVVNRSDDHASYEVRLTASVTEIRIRIGNEPEQRLVPAAGMQRWTIDISEQRP